jgi:hypothetical protein
VHAERVSHDWGERISVSVIRLSDGSDGPIPVGFDIKFVPSYRDPQMFRTTYSLVALSLVALGACQKDSTPIITTSQDGASLSSPADSAQARGNALVRIVNAVAGGKTIAAQVEGRTLFPEILQGQVSDYVEIKDNLAKFSVNTPGGPDLYTFQANEQLLVNGNRYTIFLIAEDVSKAVLRIVRDDVVPDSGKAKLRVVHAAPGGPAFDVIAKNGTAKLFSGISFKAEAGYIDVEPATIDLEFRAKDGAKVLLRVPGVELQRGTATTIVITGSSTLQYIKFRDLMLTATPKA